MINRGLAIYLAFKFTSTYSYIIILGHVLLKFIIQLFWYRYHLMLSISVIVICIDRSCLDENLGSKVFDEFGDLSNSPPKLSVNF